MRSENERRLAVVAATYISSRYLCTTYISLHSKDPKQDQLRNPFIPYIDIPYTIFIYNHIYIYYIYILISNLIIINLN